MNKIIDVAKRSKAIMGGSPAVCPICDSGRWISPFDKLYIAAYGKCTDCSTVEELERLGQNIFAIIEQTDW